MSGKLTKKTGIELIKNILNVGLGVHQGLALRSYLLFVKMGEVTKEIQCKVLWCIILA